MWQVEKPKKPERFAGAACHIVSICYQKMTKNYSLRHVIHLLDSPVDADLLASNSLEIRLACSSADWEIAHPMLKQEHSLGLSPCELPCQWLPEHGYHPLIAESSSDSETRADTVYKATNWT